MLGDERSAPSADFQLRGLLAEHKIATSLSIACSSALGSCLHAQRSSDLRFLRGLLRAGIPQQSVLTNGGSGGCGVARLWGCLRLLKLIDMVRELQAERFVEHGLPIFDAEVRAGDDGGETHSRTEIMRARSMRIELARQGLLSCFTLPCGTAGDEAGSPGVSSEFSCTKTRCALERATGLVRRLGWLRVPSEIGEQGATCGMTGLRAEMMPLLESLGVGCSAPAASERATAALRALRQYSIKHPLEAFARSFLAWSRTTIALADRLPMHAKFITFQQLPQRAVAEDDDADDDRML